MQNLPPFGLPRYFLQILGTYFRYAKALDNELGRIRPKPYFERSILESLFERQPSGFLLCGVAGSGKSTLLQAIALKQVENVLRRPQSEKIPIFFPARLWRDGKISDQVWELARQYSKLKKERFYKWLARGRLVLILDGLDESAQPKVMLQKIRELKARYPDTVLVASCRSHFLPHATPFLDLQTVEMPNLSKDEAEVFIRLFNNA